MQTDGTVRRLFVFTVGRNCTEMMLTSNCLFKNDQLESDLRLVGTLALVVCF